MSSVGVNDDVQVPLRPSIEFKQVIKELSRQWRLEIREPMPHEPFILEMHQGRLQLCQWQSPRLGPLYVDFVAGALAHRRKFGGGRRQAIARAVGIKSGVQLSVIDATAGWGRDAFVLASLGCRVHMIERSAVMAALLSDGLSRAQQDVNIGSWIQSRLSLAWQDSMDVASPWPFIPEVVYLDPMFPEKRKSALVKKEMRALQILLGVQVDAEMLLSMAFAKAQERVVVKRSALASALSAQLPQTVIKTRKNRFDVYFIHKGID